MGNIDQENKLSRLFSIQLPDQKMWTEIVLFRIKDGQFDHHIRMYVHGQSKED